jgi:hypothetical protein
VEDQRGGEYVAECFWAGVTEEDLAALDERASVAARELSRQGQEVRYLGSLLTPGDEVVFCRFEGSEESGREAAQRAAIPYERIVRATHSIGHPAPSTIPSRPEPVD